MKVVQGRRLRAAVAVVLVGALGCTGGGAPAPGGAGGSDAPGADPAALASIDAEARLQLERELGAHTMLVIDSMRATADKSRRRGDARRALERNTDRLRGAVGEAFDTSAAAFNDIWVARIEALLTTAGGSDAADDLAAAQGEYGSFVAEALDEQIAPADAAAQLAELDDQLLEQMDAYADDDLDEAFTTQREAFSTAVRLGRQLVVAAGPAPEVTAGATELRSALQQLFGEHAALTVLTTRHAARGSAQTQAAGAALNGNSQDIAAALLSIYGEQPAVRFDEGWRDAISASVDLAVAAAELEDGDRRRARRRLDAAIEAVTDSVAAMTQETIEEADAQQRLAAYFQRVRRHSTAVANGRWTRAYDWAARLYAAGSNLGEWLGSGIAAHRADEFPAQ